ncbi:MAG: AAA family ATPase [Candidatus Omnitrophota bacterium]
MPFENTNDLSFFYYSSHHKEALARMQYAVIQRKVGVILTGDYGVGKTFVSSALMKMCLEGKCVVNFIPNPRLTPIEFIQEVNFQMGGDRVYSPATTKMDMLRSIKERLEHYFNRDLRPVLLIDEAQSITDDDLMEEIRLLLNIQADSHALFTLILCGQPQLEEKIEKFPQLKQRISIRYQLLSLDKEEVKEYIKYRLKVAGTTQNLFEETTYMHIFNLSKGMPRAINNICDLSLLTGFIRRLDIIGDEVVLHVARDLREES